MSVERASPDAVNTADDREIRKKRRHGREPPVQAG